MSAGKRVAIVHAQQSDEEEETLTNALENMREFETASTILNTTSDKVKKKVPPLEKASEFYTRARDLADYVGKVEPLLRPVCEFLFDFIEWALMKYLTRHHKENIAIKQAWPAEWAQIDTILASVKRAMEAVDGEFKEAMEIIKEAVSYSDRSEITKALMKYGSIQSKIQPVFEFCLENVKEAQAILNALGPKVGKVILDSKNRAMKVSVSVPVVALVLAYMYTEAWVGVIFAALIILIVCFGFAILERSELRNGLAYYNTEIRLIIRIQCMKGQLTSLQAYLSGLTN